MRNIQVDNSSKNVGQERFQKWLDEIEYKNWKFTVAYGPHPIAHRQILNLNVDAGFVVDSESGEQIPLITTQLLHTYPAMSKDHFIALVDQIVLDIEKHEHYEFFKVGGKRWQDPH